VGLRAGLDWCGKSHPHQEFYTCTVHKYRQVVVFNGTLDLMWAGGGFLSKFCGFLGIP